MKFFTLAVFFCIGISSFAQPGTVNADSLRRQDSIMAAKMMMAQVMEDSIRFSDSIVRRDFNKLVKEMNTMKADTNVDRHATYDILFVTSCPFTETFYGPADKDKKNHAGDSFDKRKAPGTCTANLKRIDRTIDVLSSLDPITLGSSPYMVSYGKKYLMVVGDKFYTYTGNQTSYGIYRIYYLEKHKE